MTYALFSDPVKNHSFWIRHSINSNGRLNWNNTSRLLTEYRAMVGREGLVH